MAGDDAPAPSATLHAVHKHINIRCGGVSDAFLACKSGNANPEACVKKGNAVTSCVVALCVIPRRSCASCGGVLFWRQTRGSWQRRAARHPKHAQAVRPRARLLAYARCPCMSFLDTLSRSPAGVAPGLCLCAGSETRARRPARSWTNILGAWTTIGAWELCLCVLSLLLWADAQDLVHLGWRSNKFTKCRTQQAAFEAAFPVA